MIEIKHRNYLEPQSRMSLLPNYYRYQFRQLAEHVSGRVIDLGCGEGHMLPFYMDTATRIVAVDINVNLLDMLKLRYPSQGISCIQCDLNGEWTPIGDDLADTVMAINVLEHIEMDGVFIEKAKSLLKPDGRLVLIVPAMKLLYSEMDRCSGHYRRYDKQDLLCFAQQHDLSTISCRYINPIGALLYHMKKNRKTNFSTSMPRFVLAMANKVMPLFVLSDHLPIEFGLSLVGVFKNSGEK